MTPDAAQRLALKLMGDHGILVKGWVFKFDRAKRRFGFCHYGKKLITLSASLVEMNDAGHVRDTILHEIAHALVGPRVHHGPAWKAMAKAIGCTGNRCYSDQVRTLQPRYTGTCPACGYSFKRHRRREGSCPKCCKVYNPKFLIVWSKAP